MLAILPKELSIADLDARVEELQINVSRLDPATLSRLKPFPGELTFQAADQLRLSTAQAQRVVARDFGFSSWATLLAELESETPRTQLATDQLACEFLRLAVLVYSETESNDPQRFKQAADLLQEHPDIADHSIYTAAALGDVSRLRSWLECQPDLLNTQGGHHDWEPLMYAAYSRLPERSTLAAGRLLLEQGADPNAHYMWGGQYKFTALTGVFGQGEGGPVKLPEHPDTAEFARAMLEAGANPNDSQAAYNRMFTDDNLCLELMLEFGLEQAEKNNWLLCDNDKLVSHPAETLHYQLMYAVRKNLQARVELLAEHGVDINRVEQDADYPRTPLEAALLNRHDKLAEWLITRGAQPANLDSVDQFFIAVQSADAVGANTLLQATPALIQTTEERFPGMLEVAVNANNADALQLMLSLGFNPNEGRARSALHQAAFVGSIDMLKQLIAAGGDTSRRDHNYFTPPLGWALHNGQTETAVFLETCDVDIFTAAVRGLDDVVVRLAAADPDCVSLRFEAIRPRPEQFFAGDWMTPLAYAIQGQHLSTIECLLKLGADPNPVDPEGRTLQMLAEHFVAQSEPASDAARNARNILALL